MFELVCTLLMCLPHQALFNFLLREYGVKDVKIQEVLGLEDEMLQYLPYEWFHPSPMLKTHIDMP